MFVGHLRRPHQDLHHRASFAASLDHLKAHQLEKRFVHVSSLVLVSDAA